MTEEKNTKNRFEEYVRNNRLFFLGAGFSAAAGIPMTNQLLAAAMERFQEESSGLFECVDGYVRDCFQLQDAPDYSHLDLSQICTFLDYQELREYGGGERWSDAGSRENLAFKYYLAKEVALRTPAVEALPELYRKFAEQLHPGDIVISFNWDTLLELSIEAVGQRYSYEITEGAIGIFKLHGSINWRLGTPDKAVGDWKSMKFTDSMMKEEIYYTDDLVRPHSWRFIPHPLGEIQPFIVLPGFGKAFDVRKLAPLWYKPEAAFAFTHDVVIIGLSLSPDDFIVRSFFLDNLPHVGTHARAQERTITIVNSDPGVRGNYEFMAGNKHVNFRFEPFSIQHLGLMLAQKS